MAAGGVTVKPASREELEAFVAQNKRWLPDEAEQVLRSMSPIDQKRVIGAGTMSSVRDPAAVIQARVRKAREMEAQIGRGQGAGLTPQPGAGGSLADFESRVSKPASKEELEAFIKGNERWLQGEAADILRGMNPIDQKRVISAGTLSGCRDPVAVIQTRAKKAREMELELENLAAGQRQQQADPPPIPPQPDFCEAAAALHLYAPPEVVLRQESKFAPPPAFFRDEAVTIVGEERGVGGVVEILKPKYGCGRGQRLKVIGETAALLQFEGGKTAPKNHEDKGWRWVVREEEEQRLFAVEAEEEMQTANAVVEEAAKATAAADAEATRSEAQTDAARARVATKRCARRASTKVKGNGKENKRKKEKKTTSISSSFTKVQEKNKKTTAKLGGKRKTSLSSSSSSTSSSEERGKRAKASASRARQAAVKNGRADHKTASKIATKTWESSSSSCSGSSDEIEAKDDTSAQKVAGNNSKRERTAGTQHLSHGRTTQHESKISSDSSSTCDQDVPLPPKAKVAEAKKKAKRDGNAKDKAATKEKRAAKRRIKSVKTELSSDSSSGSCMKECAKQKSTEKTKAKCRREKKTGRTKTEKGSTQKIKAKTQSSSSSSSSDSESEANPPKKARK